MARVVFPTDLQQYTNGVDSVEVTAGNYGDLVVELSTRFPQLTREILEKQALGINGAVVPEPMLETFDENAELVFFGWIQGG